MSEFAMGVVVTSGMLVLLGMGVRVYVAASIAGLVGLLWMLGWDSGAGMVGTVPHSKTVNYVLSVVEKAGRELGVIS